MDEICNRFSVLNVLKTWIERCPEAFLSNQDLFKQLEGLIQEIRENLSAQTADQMMDTLLRFNVG